MGNGIPIVEVLPNGDTKGRGEFEFRHIPANGDRLVIPSGHGSSDIVRVLYVEHTPAPLPRGPCTENQKPSLMIFVEYIDDYFYDDD